MHLKAIRVVLLLFLVSVVNSVNGFRGPSLPKYLSLSYGIQSSGINGTGFNLLYNRGMFFPTKRSRVNFYGVGLSANSSKQLREIGLLGYIAPGIGGFAIRINRKHVSYPFLSTQVNYHTINRDHMKSAGINIRPGVGLRSFYRLSTKIGLCLNLQYGYSFGVQSDQYEDAHYYEAKLGLGLAI